MTKHLLLLSFLVITSTVYCSCHFANDKQSNCLNDFRSASKLAYTNSNNKASLESALTIIDKCMQCDSLRKSVIELKIRLLTALKKFKEGSDFIDSLQSSDFEYPYKKKLIHNNFIALNFTSNRDTRSGDSIFRKMSIDLENYINDNNLKSKELHEAYIDLFSLKEKFLDSITINREVDSLKIKYPNNANFFDFLKR